MFEIEIGIGIGAYFRYRISVSTLYKTRYTFLFDLLNKPIPHFWPGSPPTDKLSDSRLSVLL